MAKKVPNPGGKLGDQVTRDTTEKVIKHYEDQGFDLIKKEFYFKKSEIGVKNRYADVLMKHPQTGEIFIINIGKLTRKGEPISREKKL